MTTKLWPGAGMQAMSTTQERMTSRKSRSWSIATLVTLASILSSGCATPTSHFGATHIHLSNNEAPLAQLDAPLFRDNAVAVDPKSLHVISKVISPTQKVHGFSQSSEGSTAIMQDSSGTTEGRVKNVNAQSVQFHAEPEPTLPESVRGTSVEVSKVRSESRILPVDDMDPSESTAVEFFRSAFESFSPFRRSTGGDSNQVNDTAITNKAEALPIEEFTINMAELPSLDDIQKSYRNRAKEKNEAPEENNTKPKRQDFFNQPPQITHHQPLTKRFRKRTQQLQNQPFISALQGPIEVTQKDIDVSLQPQNLDFVNFEISSKPRDIVRRRNLNNSPPVYKPATLVPSVPYAAHNTARATIQNARDKTPIYQARKSASRPLTPNKRFKTPIPKMDLVPHVPKAQNYAVGALFSPYASYSAVQPSMKRANTALPVYGAHVFDVAAQSLSYSAAHPRREFTESESYPAYSSLNSAPYSDHTYSSLQYQIPVPSYTHQFQVQEDPYIPVVSLKNIYPNILSLPSSSSQSPSWPNVKPSYEETPPYLRDLENSFETGPIFPSAKSSRSTSSTPEPSEEKQEPPTIINHIHISERRRPGVDREFTIDSGSEDTEWVLHKSNHRSSGSDVGSAAKVRISSRKESGRYDDEKAIVLRTVHSKEKRTPAYISKREHLRSFHPLMVGHRFTEALRVVDNDAIPEFYLKPMSVRVPSKVRSEEKNQDAVANNNGGFFSTIMKFFGQSDSQLKNSESIELERHSNIEYKPIYRDRFEELIANLDNDSFDAFLTAVKVNQIFGKSLKRLRRNNGLLNTATLFSRRSDSIPTENTEELANRMVEDFVSVLFEKYPTIAHQIELNKPFIPPPQGIHRDLFVRPQERASHDSMEEYIGLHNFTENLNDFSNRYSGNTRQWADYMSHLLTEQYFRSVNVSQPVRENIDLMVNGFNNDDLADRKMWEESFPPRDSSLNIRGTDTNTLRQNYEKHDSEHLSGEVKVELGYNGTSDSVLHNMLSDILGNFIDFGGTKEAPLQKPARDFVKSSQGDSRQPSKLGISYNDPSYDYKECSGGDCLKYQSEVRRSNGNEHSSSSTDDDHNILFDRLSWIFKENPEQLQSKVIEYINQKYSNSGDQNEALGQSNFGYNAFLKENEFDTFDGKDKRLFEQDDNKFLKNKKNSAKMNAKEIDLLVAYLAHAYPYFWANILGSYPAVQSYAPNHLNTPSTFNLPAEAIGVSGLEYVRDLGMNGVPLAGFKAPPAKYPYVGQEMQEGVDLRDLQILRAPTGSHSAYGSSFNVGVGHHALTGRLNPSMHTLVRPDLHSYGMYPNSGRVHSLTHTGLQSAVKPASGAGYWLRNGGLNTVGELRGRLRDTRRKKVKANLGNTHSSSSFLEGMKENSSYDDYDDYEIEILSEIRRPGDDATMDSNILAYKNHKHYDPPNSRKIRKQKRKYKHDHSLSTEKENSEDNYSNFSTEDEKARRTWSDEATRQDASDQDSEIRISLIQEIGKTRKQAQTQGPLNKNVSSNKGKSNSDRRSSNYNSSEVLDKSLSKTPNEENTDSRVIINIGYPFPSTESSTASIISRESDVEAEEPKSSIGFLGSLRYLFNSYLTNSGEVKKKGNTGLQQPMERESKDDEEGLEKRIAFSHVDPKTRVHTIVTTSNDEVEDHQPSTEYQHVRKPPRLIPIRRKPSRVKNLARGQRIPTLTDNIHGGSFNIQNIAYANFPKETKKLFPLVDFEEVSFTETFLGDSTETFQTPKPLDQFDLDPLNPSKPKNMSKMTDTVAKVVTQPGTIYFHGGPMVRYQTGKESARK